MVIFFLVLLFGGAYFYYKNTKETRVPAKEKASELTSQELDIIVNKYIKTTNQEALKTKIMAEKFMLEARRKLAEIEKEKKLKQDKENAAIPKEQQIHKNSDTNYTPTEILLSQANEKKDQNRMDETEKQEYARQWILNASKAGYLLELSPDLEVIKYTPIRKPSQQDDSTESTPSD